MKNEVIGVFMGKRIDNYIEIVDIIESPYTFSDVEVEIPMEFILNKIVPRIRESNYEINVKGYYHSHLGYALTFSNVDKEQYEKFLRNWAKDSEGNIEPFISLIIDPTQGNRFKIVTLWKGIPVPLPIYKDKRYKNLIYVDFNDLSEEKLPLEDFELYDTLNSLNKKYAEKEKEYFERKKGEIKSKHKKSKMKEAMDSCFDTLNTICSEILRLLAEKGIGNEEENRIRLNADLNDIILRESDELTKKCVSFKDLSFSYTPEILDEDEKTVSKYCQNLIEIIEKYIMKNYGEDFYNIVKQNIRKREDLKEKENISDIYRKEIEDILKKYYNFYIVQYKIPKEKKDTAKKILSIQIKNFINKNAKKDQLKEIDIEDLTIKIKPKLHMEGIQELLGEYKELLSNYIKDKVPERYLGKER